MLEKRKEPRYVSQAKVRLPQVEGGELLLKDISIIGCGVESSMMLDVAPHNQYKMQVIPEDRSGIRAFELLVEASWIRASECAFEAGFLIVESPKGRQFQRYVDYLSWSPA